jgi:predicted RNA-binding Zn ribbon-like protein
MVFDSLSVSSARSEGMDDEVQQKWPWLGDHLALDVANTVRVEGGRRVELLTTPADLAGWLDVEPAPLPRPDVLDDHCLTRFRTVRDAALLILHSAAAGESLPADAVDEINHTVRAASVHRLLTANTREAEHIVAQPDSTLALTGHAAAAVVDLIARDDLANLAVCHAPACGQFFHRARPNQRWCSPGCGNRARVDRHRHRRTHPR